VNDFLIGLFVGGRGSRLGGVAKGNLQTADGERLIGRLIDVCREALKQPELVFVGTAEPYLDFGLPVLSDAPAGVGPIGGLRALLLAAEARGVPSVISLACDLPFVSAGLVRRLATEQLDAAFLSPRDGEFWQPLIARYQTAAALAAVDAALLQGERALKSVVARLGPHTRALALDEREQLELRDCDSPSDVAAAGLRLPRDR
jgi:molybdopterin-guanine dinucleotide biosynthesis protein A